MTRDTIRVVASDAVQDLHAHIISAGLHAQSALITCEAFDIRFCLGDAVPTQGANGLGHILYAKQSMALEEVSDLRTLSFINYTNGSDAILQITLRD